jgi:cytochrome c oxidase subunit 4
MGHQKTSVGVYLWVFAALLVLLALAVGVAFIDLGAWSVVLALSIATAKALLIVLYFMHVRSSSRLTQLFTVGMLLWLLILIVITLSDYLTRGAPWPSG